MNFYDLQDAYFNHLGTPSGDARLDHMVQTARDHINQTQDDIYMRAPYMWWMVREATITPITGTTVYTLNDYAERAMEFWVEGENAHKVKLNTPREADRNGLRNSNLQAVSVGPYDMTWYPRTTTAAASGTSASCTIATTSLTKSGGSDWTSALEGRMIRLNGESADYIASTVTGTSAITMDRAYRSRIVGTGTSGTQSSLSGKRWEIGPPGRLQVEVFGASTGGDAINYRYQRRHRVLIHDDETPEMPERYHHIILYGALLNSAIFRQNPQDMQMWQQRYESGIMNMLTEERDQHDLEHQARYESPIRLDTALRALPYGTYSRRYGSIGPHN